MSEHLCLLPAFVGTQFSDRERLCKAHSHKYIRKAFFFFFFFLTSNHSSDYVIHILFRAW